MDKIKFLMTDTGAQTTQLCRQALEAKGIDVTVCEKNGSQALKSLLEEHPQAVLLDAFMPDLDAITVKQRYETQDTRGGHTTFFVTGAFQSEEVEQDLLDNGFSFFFVKPFDENVLVSRVLKAAGSTSRPQPVSQDCDELTVTEILHQVGVPAHIKGYQFLRDAILLAVSDHDYINAVTKRLYPEIAKRNATTASRVERAIRHAIEVAWDRGDIETLQELCRQLRHAGAKSDASRGCGVHIHIGAQGHTPQSLRNLANIMASHESLIAEALKLDRGRMNRYCRTVDPRFLEQVNRRKPRTMSQLADIWYNSNGASYGRNHHYNDSRYHMLNLHATFTKGTVEFRLFQFDEPTAERRGGIHAGQLKSYIQLCLALSQMAKDVRTASPKPQQNENPKYAMRTWLLRLGFIGEEFATARDFLTRNLSGDTAFRHGRAAA